MPNQTFKSRGIFVIECKWAIDPEYWVRKQMLERSIIGASGLHFKRGQTFLNVDTPPAINVPTSLCYSLIHRLTGIVLITEVFLYSNGIIKIVLKCEPDENKLSACIDPDQRQSLEEAEFFACAIVEDFVQEHPVE